MSVYRTIGPLVLSSYDKNGHSSLDMVSLNVDNKEGRQSHINMCHTLLLLLGCKT